MQGRFRYSATLSRSGFTGKTFYLLNHIVLNVENIDIVLANMHAGASDRDLFQSFKNDAINRAGIVFR